MIISNDPYCETLHLAMRDYQVENSKEIVSVAFILSMGRRE